MASSIAFFWAEEPSPVRVPLKHSVAALSLAEADELEPSALVVPVVLSEPHAARAIEPTTARLASWARRVVFTVLPQGLETEGSGTDGVSESDGLRRPTALTLGMVSDASVRAG